jgi:hypothetical protein
MINKCPICKKILAKLKLDNYSMELGCQHCPLPNGIERFFYDIDLIQQKINRMWIILEINDFLYDFDYFGFGNENLVHLMSRDESGNNPKIEIKITEYLFGISQLSDQNFYNNIEKEIKRFLTLKEFL